MCGKKHVTGQGPGMLGPWIISWVSAERLHDLGTSDDLHGSYHLHIIWFPPSVCWGNAHTFLILFSGSSIDVLELVTVWKKMRLNLLSFLNRFENCLLCLCSFSCEPLQCRYQQLGYWFWCGVGRGQVLDHVVRHIPLEISRTGT